MGIYAKSPSFHVSTQLMNATLHQKSLCGMDKLSSNLIKTTGQRFATFEANDLGCLLRPRKNSSGNFHFFQGILGKRGNHLFLLDWGVQPFGISEPK